MSNVRFDELELMLMAMFQRYDSGVDGDPAACGRGCGDGCSGSADDPEDAAVE